MHTALFVSSALLLVATFAACSDDATVDDPNQGGDAAAASSSSSGEATSSSSSGQATSSSSSSSSSGDAATTSSSSSGSSDSDAGTCAGFAATGPEVTPTVTNDGAPGASGGDIADGTYQLTAVTSYGGSPAVTTSRVKTTLQIEGGRFLRGFVFTAFGQTVTGAEGGTFTSDGVTVTATSDCSDGDANGGYGQLGGEYTATETRLVLFQDPPPQTGGTKITFTLDRQ